MPDPARTPPDSGGGGFQFVYRATVRRDQAHAAFTEAFALLAAEIHADDEQSPD